MNRASEKDLDVTQRRKDAKGDTDAMTFALFRIFAPLRLCVMIFPA